MLIRWKAYQRTVLMKGVHKQAPHCWTALAAAHKRTFPIISVPVIFLNSVFPSSRCITLSCQNKRVCKIHGIMKVLIVSPLSAALRAYSSAEFCLLWWKWNNQRPICGYITEKSQTQNTCRPMIHQSKMVHWWGPRWSNRYRGLTPLF